MDSFRSSFRILFNLELGLPGYQEDLNQYIRLLPDEDTHEAYTRYRILPRKQKNASVALVEVEPDGPDLGRPRVMLPDDHTFRFQVKFADNAFFSRTHLASYDLSSEALLLSNEVNHVEGTDLLLSRAIPNYSSGDTYLAGYLVRSGSDHYKALQASDGGDPHPVSDTAYWKSIPNGTFVSQADLQPRPAFADLDAAIIVEVKHSPLLPAAYRLLDASQRCREVSYKINLLMKH